MSRQYEALVEITVRDTESLKPLPPVRINVKFDPPDDPRETLSKTALQAAVEHAKLAEGFLWM